MISNISLNKYFYYLDKYLSILDVKYDFFCAGWLRKLFVFTGRLSGIFCEILNIKPTKTV